jgi:hypothetical protein
MKWKSAEDFLNPDGGEKSRCLRDSFYREKKPPSQGGTAALMSLIVQDDLRR